MTPNDADDHTARLRSALGIAPPGAMDNSPEVREAICEYVAYLKEQGESSSRVVVLVKDALTRAGLTKHMNQPHALIDGVVTSCIREFYRDVR